MNRLCWERLEINERWCHCRYKKKKKKNSENGKTSKDLEQLSQLTLLDWVCKYPSQIFPDNIAYNSFRLSDFSFVRLFVKGMDLLLCSLYIVSCAFLTKAFRGMDTHTQKKPSWLRLCKHCINRWSAWASWWFVCAHLGLKSSDMRWMWSSLTFWEAPSALQSIWNAVCSHKLTYFWVKLNFQVCKYI